MRAEFHDAMRVLRPADKKAILVLAALAVASVGLEILGLLAVTPLMSFLGSPETASSHLSVRVIEQVFQPKTPSQTLLILFLILMGVFAFKNVYIGGIHILNYRYARAGSVWIARQLLELYFYRSVERERVHSIPEAVRNIKEIGPNLYFIIVISFVNLITESCIIAGIGLLLLWIQPFAAVAAAVMMSVSIALQYYLYGHKVRDLGGRATAISRESYKSLFQALGAHKEIRLRGKEEYFIERLLAQQNAETTFSKKQRLLYAVSGQVNEIGMLVAIAVVISVIILRSEHIFAAFSTIALFAAASLRLMPTVNRLIHAVGELQSHGADIAILRKELEAREREIKTEMAQPEEGPLRFEREISLKAVSYHYPGRTEPALRDVDLTIRRGEFIGVAGPSGAGKSTLTDILMCLIPPSEGGFKLDGTDVWAKPRGLRALIGYVPQTVYLMEDSLRRNIAFGEADSAIDDVRARSALRMAQLDGFLARLPRGLETVLGGAEGSVSGGERQRIGIARALYHQPEILVLDEVTSQLDSETEHALSQVLSGLKGERTLIVIAHRLSTVKNCDRVAFMKEGRIVDSATFPVLAERNKDFARMIALADLGLLPEKA
jgi:ATP-binding cassette, subfamily B, bacterial PglK